MCAAEKELPETLTPAQAELFDAFEKAANRSSAMEERHLARQAFLPAREICR